MNYILNLESTSSAYRRSLLDIGFSNCIPLGSILGLSHPAPANRLAKIITSPGLWTSHTIFAETQSPLKNPLTLTLISSAANMVSPLPLQLTKP